MNTPKEIYELGFKAGVEFVKATESAPKEPIEPKVAPVKKSSKKRRHRMTQEEFERMSEEQKNRYLKRLAQNRAYNKKYSERKRLNRTSTLTGATKIFVTSA